MPSFFIAETLKYLYLLFRYEVMWLIPRRKQMIPDACWCVVAARRQCFRWTGGSSTRRRTPSRLLASETSLWWTGYSTPTSTDI